MQFISFHRWDSLKAKKSELLGFSRQACVLGLKISPLMSWTVWKPKDLIESDSVAKPATSLLTYIETFIFLWTELGILFKCVYYEFVLINRQRLLCQRLLMSIFTALLYIQPWHVLNSSLTVKPDSCLGILNVTHLNKSQVFQKSLNCFETYWLGNQIVYWSDLLVFNIKYF